MGCCSSTDASSSSGAPRVTEHRDIRSVVDAMRSPADVKVLMLGPGESGKSTFLKQTKILFQDGYTKEELLQTKEIIFSNVVLAMFMLVKAAHVFNFPISPPNRDAAEKILDFGDNDQLCVNRPEIFTPELTQEIKALWRDPGIQQAFKRRSEFQLRDSADYFFEQLDRLSSEDYIPTYTDLLRCRVTTLGIVSTEFDMEGVHIRLFDVGGQRAERKKWIKAFEGVTALLFFVAISEFDQVCFEDERTNRMMESLLLFGDTINSKHFMETPIILFLNKKDLFEERIKEKDLSVVFPDYDGGHNYEAALSFIANKFRKENRNPHRQIYIHITCATDTDGIRPIITAVKDIILEHQLRLSGLL